MGMEPDDEDAGAGMDTDADDVGIGIEAEKAGAPPGTPGGIGTDAGVGNCAFRPKPAGIWLYCIALEGGIRVCSVDGGCAGDDVGSSMVWSIKSTQ